MNWDQVEGKWKQFKGKAKEKWGKLTDDDLDVIAGKRDQLAGQLQVRYGIAKDEAERQISEFEAEMDDVDDNDGAATYRSDVRRSRTVKM
jgi:uncharacterized protein YjbJ (UPF0337 family)